MRKYGIEWDKDVIQPSIFPELGEIEYLIKEFPGCTGRLLVMSICSMKPISYCVSDDEAKAHIVYRGLSKAKAIQSCIQVIAESSSLAVKEWNPIY